MMARRIVSGTYLRGDWVLFGMAVVLLAFTVAPDTALAGADTTFDDVWVTMRDWTQGSLGKVISGTFVLIGLVYGAAKQSVLGFATGAGAGIGLYASPDVIEEMVSATLPLVSDVAISAAGIITPL